MSSRLPQHFSDQPFCYINLTGKLNQVVNHKNYGKYVYGISFQHYKLGDGILKNVMADDEIV